METVFTLRQTAGYAIDVSHDGWALRIDLTTRQGGTNTGPGPTDLVPIALAACEMMLALLTAKKHGHPLEGVEAKVTKQYATNPTRLGDMRVEVKNVLSQLPPELHERVRAAIEACPVLQTLKHPPAVHSEVQ